MSKVCSLLSNVHFTDYNAFFKIVYVGKSKCNNIGCEIYIQINFADITKVFITLFWTLLSHVSG